MKYSHIIFDADETLFHFDAFLGLQTMFKQHDVAFSQQDYNEYQTLNAPLWVQYQEGKIDAQTLQVTRFNTWATKLSVSPELLNLGFLNAMAEICKPLPGAHSLLSALNPTTSLNIITNGFSALQEKRLNNTGFKHFFDHVVISEQVGVAKPDPQVFEHTLELLGNPDKANVLMVGDTPKSDILGANRFGIDSCWLQHDGQTCPDDIKPTYRVGDLAELETLLVK
ncbi:pyrimidine 5'-nucleotidase [Pseudoalteromonas luteoviolacea]|uniref:pyrimidine 5'-nucleotidase n=1 Tax=Pseudoalteromonas luteoviolacea TaxID=43657 RepID=UPI001B36EDC3|nr:pyrimidine 5'-nucleotidase [Pseudoalteromonas luteoviolacea]MBQ4838138.1 pyrimidine 5'-nucleotidase [Pseudoalteromonas luteoviolacea]